MKTLFLTMVVAAALAAGCGKAPVQQDPASFFTIEADEVATVGGDTNYAAVLIHPAKDKHWNRDFPASARVTDAGGLVTESTSFDRQAFVVKDGHARLNIPVMTSSPGAFKLQVAVNFSMCDNLACKDFENIPVTIPFEVTDNWNRTKPPESTNNAQKFEDPPPGVKVPE